MCQLIETKEKLKKITNMQDQNSSKRKRDTGGLSQGSRMLILEISTLPSFRNAYVFLYQVWFKYWNREVKSFRFKIIQF